MGLQRAGRVKCVAGEVGGGGPREWATLTSHPSSPPAPMYVNAHGSFRMPPQYAMALIEHKWSV